MKIMRLWFVVILAVAILREEPFFSEEKTEIGSSMWIDLQKLDMPFISPEAPPMPAPKTHGTLIDPVTGTWNAYWKAWMQEPATQN